MHLRDAVAAILIAGLATQYVLAQGQGPVLSPMLLFEVASVKINKSRTRAPMLWQPGGHFTMGLPILSLVSLGYEVPPVRIVGLPDWVGTVFFNINARADRQTTLDERRAYYRGLLEDRFRLVAHVEERELPAYSLLLARNDGRLGPGLRRSDVECEPIMLKSASALKQASARPRPRPEFGRYAALSGDQPA